RSKLGRHPGLCCGVLAGLFSQHAGVGGASVAGQFRTAITSVERKFRAFTGMSGRRWRRAFVVLQVSLSFVLAGAAFLSLESYFHLSRSASGYNTYRMVATHLTVPLDRLCSQVPSQTENHAAGTSPASDAKAGAPENNSCAQSFGAFETAILAEVRALPAV